ncbi:MAG: hypothetical protein PHF99_12200 [Bacteroidales bacterium]|nr:hypothetical protein [Bacteroidales bacterium]MDD4236767.1 hypothetical protein [Bacteroidales bacterium]
MIKKLILIIIVFNVTITFAQDSYHTFSCFYNKPKSVDGILLTKYRVNNTNTLAIGNNSESKLGLRSSKHQNTEEFVLKYKRIIELGYMDGISYYDWNRVKFNFINGVQLNRLVSLGFGTGFNYYFNNKNLFLPIYADLRVNLLERKTFPYISFDIGYSFDVQDKFGVVGLILNSTLGFSYTISNRAVLNLGIGYDMQRFYINNNTKNTGAISVTLGITSLG